MSDMFVSRFGFLATASIMAAIETLIQCAGGRFASVIGYRPTGGGWTVVPTYNATVLTRFSTERLYARKLAALDAITFDMISDAIKADPVLADCSMDKLQETFTIRKALLRDSLTKTRVDTAGHREGQARCHVPIVDGVRVHLVTAKGDDGLMYPVLRDGLPIADCVRLNVIEQQRTYTVPGIRKVVNSGVPVRITKAIESLMRRRSVGFTSLSLRDNFEALNIDGRSVDPDDESVYVPNGNVSDDD